MNKFYENTEGQLFVDPILANHVGLTEITQKQFNEKLAELNKSTTDQLLQQLTQARKEQERQGVTINDVRYGGEPENRQALQESIAFMNDAGLTEFEKFKDSDNVFHVDLPVSEVFNAYRAVGMRRVQLISAEGDYAEQIITGTLSDLTQVTWP